MRREVFLAILLTIPCPAVAGRFENGNDIFDWCTDSGKISSCQAYVVGIADAMSGGDRVYGRHACFQTGVAARQIQDVVVGYLSRHAAERQYDAAFLIAGALQESFPCTR